MEWAESVKNYRIKNGLKQAALAEDLGVDVTTVSRWERGLSKPTKAVMATMAAAVGLTIGVTLYVNQAPDTELDKYMEMVQSDHSPPMVILDDQFRINAVSPELDKKRPDIKLRAGKPFENSFGETFWTAINSIEVDKLWNEVERIIVITSPKERPNHVLTFHIHPLEQSGQRKLVAIQNNSFGDDPVESWRVLWR